MMRYVLDTNAIISLLRGRGGGIAEKIRKYGIDSFCIADITLYELYCGAMYSRNPEREMARVESIASRLEVIGAREFAREAARQKTILRAKGDIIEDFDILIGASAVSRGYTLVSGNAKHMSRLQGIKVESW